MNGFARRGQNSFDAGRPQMLRPADAPKGSALVDSYRHNSLNGFPKEKPKSNPMNPDRAQSSVLVDLKDAVQVHLLAETALFDSKEYEILSQEEVDNLKKQCQLLNQRIEQTRSSLAIQTKYRDAALSMSRLYSPRSEGKRKSFMGNRGSGGSDAAREAEQELDTIQKKCEDLASELWALERRIMEPKQKLLEHTAGILQHTHKTTKQTTTPSSKVPLVNGVPASPESMYTTSNGRDSMDFLDDGFVFDEASLYRSFDMSEAFGAPSRQNTFEIPLKSPIREQNKQLLEESDKLREENEQLRAQMESLLSEVNELRDRDSDQWRLISDTETKLEAFNSQLRAVIVKTDPARNSSYGKPPSGQAEPGDMIGSHLEYLENGLFVIGDSQGNSAAVASKVQALNLQIQDVLLDVNPSHPSPPDLSRGVDDQITYLQDSLRTVEDELQRVADLANSGSADKQASEQSEAVLMGLWDIIQSGYADIRSRKQDRRKTRMEKGLEPDEDDMSDRESFDVDEAYSLSAFSTKIQWLYSQATKLQEQKGVLKRQIKQQRELNNKSDSEKDQAMRDKIDELEQARMRLGEAEKETDNVRAQLSAAFEDLEQLQNGRSEEAAEVEGALEEARGQLKDRNDQLKDRNDKIAALERDTRDVQARLATAEANIDTIAAQLKEANDAKDAAEKAVEEKQTEIKAKEEELGQMTGMVAEYKMEATLAKAELDGAYGTRKERAAEVAALHNSSESAKLQNRVEALEQELKATAKDLTDVVKQSLESEKKIGDLEDELDRVKTERSRLRDEKDKVAGELEQRLEEATGVVEERLEREIARLRKEKEQVQDELDNQRLRSATGPLSPGGTTKTSFLTDSYRVGLRAERKKFEEQMRAEQIVRRKLEDELRSLKRAHGPGKSPLSPR
ncbi:Up-regulated during septation-domain-containing protein [Xylariomycetidae sp. FL2044]|nr:Up-regulated during septation-domain-containing protein [Xylariomycetidae sp. FL2044]